MKRVVIFLTLFMAVTFYGLIASSPQTPLEKAEYSRLTSYAEMTKYLQKLDAQSRIMSLKTIGKSVEGREIRALFFSLEKNFGEKRKNKPVVLIFCQQHGDEPSGKEAALKLAGYLIEKGQSVLNRIDLILVPQVNPDGAETGKRRNANDMDLNRNHVILSEPEALAIHRLFLKWKPEVAVDIHEYNAIKKSWIENGFIKDADEMLGGVTNLNIDSRLTDFSRTVIMPEVGKKVTDSGFSFHRYIVGEPFPPKRIRYSTTNINDGRQSTGIYNTLSFIIEGKRYGDVLNRIKQRTDGQFAAQLAFLQVIAAHSAEILTLVKNSRQRLSQNQTDNYIHLQMDYFPDPNQKTLKFPVFDFYKWKRVEKELPRFEPLVKVKKSVAKPFAYIFSQKEKRLIELLTKHQIKMYRLAKNALIPVEVYKILHTTPAIDEDKPTLNVDAEKRKENLKFFKGDVFVPLNQPASNLIPLLLEPESTWNICQKRNGHQYRFAEYLTVGKEYPVKRVPRAIQLELKDNE
ncbi:MAG: DUF2817 domain-containing protein [Calditrichaeota bacterium]|nr:DUF2817 domain-containing protein [Calditrichota bacterium]